MPRRFLADLGCLGAALVPGILFAGFMLFLEVAGIDWEHQAAGGNFNLLWMIVIPPTVVAVFWIGWRRVTGRGYSVFRGFQLDSMSDDQLLTLWRSLEAGSAPAAVAPERVEAFRQAITDAASRRGLSLGSASEN